MVEGDLTPPPFPRFPWATLNIANVNVPRYSTGDLGCQVGNPMPCKKRGP